MADKTAIIKPVAAIAGVAFVSTLSVGTDAVADNPFELTDLDAGYMLADGHKGEEGKCGEGKCGDDKGEEGKCGEGKCGTDGEKGEEGKCGSDGEKGEEGKCGEGKCGS
jgi:uncharacterized low-complexity protein